MELPRSLPWLRADTRESQTSSLQKELSRDHKLRGPALPTSDLGDLRRCVQTHQTRRAEQSSRIGRRGPIHTGSNALLSRRSKLTKKTPLVGPHPLLERNNRCWLRNPACPRAASARARSGQSRIRRRFRRRYPLPNDPNAAACPPPNRPCPSRVW